jgi:hypothetical protein
LNYFGGNARPRPAAFKIHRDFHLAFPATREYTPSVRFFGSGTNAEKDRSSGNWQYTVAAGKAEWIFRLRTVQTLLESATAGDEVRIWFGCAGISGVERIDPSSYVHPWPQLPSLRETL